MSTRERGTITNVFLGKEDHDLLTCTVGIDFNSSYQAFGCLIFDTQERAEDFVNDLLTLFQVPKLEQIKGRDVIALRCFPGFGTTIEGLETPEGRRFILTEWRRKHWPETADPLQDAKESCDRTIAHCLRRIADESHKKARLDLEYVE